MPRRKNAPAPPAVAKQDPDATVPSHPAEPDDDARADDAPAGGNPSAVAGRVNPDA